MYDVLARFKARLQELPTVDVTYDPSEPLSAPVILDFPMNGLRLRFDGPDQRLRLIEVLDFARMRLTYEGKDVVKIPETAEDGGNGGPGCSSPLITLEEIQGPTFRYVYDRLVAPTFPGAYVPPAEGSSDEFGTYVLSYPGIAFSFPLKHSAWSPQTNFNILLSSNAAKPATSMAIFNGASWEEVSQDLYSRPCANPRSLALHGRGREQQPDEVELGKICGNGTVELVRRSTPSFRITLGETTPQDLVTELGPPDQIKRGKSDVNLDIHKGMFRDQQSAPPYGAPASLETSSAHITADDSDLDEHQNSKLPGIDGEPVECFYNYFRHGLDVFVSAPTKCSSSNRLVATKVLMHGNVPGSFQFKRYRRCRWTLELENRDHNATLDSETPFQNVIKSLDNVWHDTSQGPSPYHSWQPVNRNRGWNSPGSSCELAGGWEEQVDKNQMGSVLEGAPGDGNAKMYGYPGTVFEVLKNNTVASVMVY